jgi:DNA/RNA-binding domain of Phe-tRNA-synthetase-like protein
LIGADDWLARSSVDGAIFDRWPGYRAILLATDDVELGPLSTVAEELLAEAEADVRSADPSTSEPHIERWHEAYRDFGVKPRVARVSVDALVRRAASDNGLPRINTLVDVYNAISVLHRVPIGGEDLDRYAGPARLVVATGDEPFHTTAHGEPLVERPDPGEPIWVDDIDITCRRWNWRQTTRTAITAGTARVGFIIDSLEAPDHAGAERAAEHLQQLMPGAQRTTFTR